MFSITLFSLREASPSIDDISFYSPTLITTFLNIILISFKNGSISARYIKTFYIFFNNLSTYLVINILARAADDRSIVYFDLIFKLYLKLVA